MSESLTCECNVQFRRRGRGARKELATGRAEPQAVEPGRVPRVAKRKGAPTRYIFLTCSRLPGSRPGGRSDKMLRSKLGVGVDVLPVR